MLTRIATFIYGGLCYLIFFGTFLYAAGFIGNLIVPKSIDSGQPGPLGQALLINAGLLALFAFQHSLMARPGFKRLWTRLVPPCLERSVYAALSGVLVALVPLAWQPLPGEPLWRLPLPLVIVPSALQMLLMVLTGWLERREQTQRCRCPWRSKRRDGSVLAPRL